MHFFDELGRACEGAVKAKIPPSFSIKGGILCFWSSFRKYDLELTSFHMIFMKERIIWFFSLSRYILMFSIYQIFSERERKPKLPLKLPGGQHTQLRRRLRKTATQGGAAGLYRTQQKNERGKIKCSLKRTPLPCCSQPCSDYLGTQLFVCSTLWVVVKP